MNPIWGPIAGASIVLMMVVFIGIWIWAWSPSHKRTFGELAQVPLHEDDEPDDTTIASGDRP